jgi:hypothetical protein
MKRFALLLIVIGCLVPLASAQETEHVQVGIYADYFRLDRTSTNFAGVGGRLAFTAYKNVKIEGETAYDFDQAFTQTFRDNTTGSITLRRSGIRILHGEFGPKINLGLERWHIHPFVTLKGGFIDFRINNAPATIGTFFTSVDDLRSSHFKGVFYPGGGLEGRVGPVGVRFDIGDEMYFSNGANNNLRIAFGPYIRF